MRAIVCGGRNITDGHFVFRVLDQLRATMGLSHVIEGGQRRRDPESGMIDGGADYWAWAWAAARGLTCDTVEADWISQKRAAGPIRNGRMLAEFSPALVIAFQGGRGTADMVEKALRKGTPVILVDAGGATLAVRNRMEFADFANWSKGEGR